MVPWYRPLRDPHITLIPYKTQKPILQNSLKGGGDHHQGPCSLPLDRRSLFLLRLHVHNREQRSSVAASAHAAAAVEVLLKRFWSFPCVGSSNSTRVEGFMTREWLSFCESRVHIASQPPEQTDDSHTNGTLLQGIQSVSRLGGEGWDAHPLYQPS